MINLVTIKTIKELILITLAAGLGLVSYQFLAQRSTPAELHLGEAGGYAQVFLGDTQLTHGKTHITPVRDGDFATWVAESDYGWQVWLAHLPSNSQIELLRKGNNVNPQIRGQQLVWEAQVNDIWQIIWFDGVQTRQISEGNLPKQNPRFVGDKIVYEEREAERINIKEYQLSAQTATQQSH